ncbi:hypothetical protein GCM10023085_04570 [Actinomadura viridis]|uniref:DUF4352 domain-containing protein n=1 Tax=Actinomadura viridis TaxID=58110 RepID=A0A931DHJ2_9ACTN|nr:hypothetical protein [Actinomadura viridis]MBG6091274.1 hypothetical protein [Actinomadura viridis]
MRPYPPRLGVIALAAALALTGTACVPKKKKSRKRGGGATAGASPSRPALGGARPMAAGPVTKVGKAFVIKPDSTSKAIVSLDSYRTLPVRSGTAFPPENGAFTVFSIRIKALRGTVHYNPLYLKLRTLDGTVLDSTDGNAPYVRLASETGPGDIPQGRLISTAIVMDARMRPGTRLHYTSVLRQVVATWRL